jgi:hypothetical protein
VPRIPPLVCEDACPPGIVCIIKGTAVAGDIYVALRSGHQSFQQVKSITPFAVTYDTALELYISKRIPTIQRYFHPNTVKVLFYKLRKDEFQLQVKQGYGLLPPR